MATVLCASNLSLQFEPVEDPKCLETVLVSRLPLSTNLCNVLKIQEAWQDDLKWYSFLDPNVNDVWILTVYFRKDFGQMISASRPPNADVTEKIREAFLHCKFVNWDESFKVYSVDLVLSSLIMDINMRDHGNSIQILPNYLFVMDPVDARKLEIKPVGCEVKRVDLKDAVFITNNYTYRSDGTHEYVLKCLSRNLSAGVYINGKLVSALILDAHGYHGMLFSLEEFRGKGYGSLAMRYLMKISAENQFIPACNVECKNEVSKSFQLKMGFKCVGPVDYIVYKKAEKF